MTDHHKADSADISPAPKKPCSVSILLLMKNELNNIREGYERICAQDYEGPVQIIYIDSGSTDGTVEFMREQGVEPHIIPPVEFHHGRTRNLAASLADNEILVLLSGDAIPTNNQWLSRLVAPFEDSKVGGVYGKQLAREGIGPLRVHGMQYTFSDEREIRQMIPGQPGSLRMVRFSNANSAIRANLWERFKFHENVIVAEDHWICYNILKQGMKVIYEPEAAVYHCHERSVWGEFRFAVENAISLKRMGMFDDPALGSELSYGLDRVKYDWNYFTRRREYGLAVKSFVISGAKCAGVQLGKREAVMPSWVMRRITHAYEKPAPPTGEVETHYSPPVSKKAPDSPGGS
ncbi:MAG: glycosyltransferase [Nitrospiraceae bacterium]|nr:glycosyltransferase [Nitrospiraceae bacterium]